MSRITMCIEEGFSGKVIGSFDLTEYREKVRAEVIDEVIKLLNSIEYSTYNNDKRRIEHHIKAQLIEQLEQLKEQNE